MRELKHTLKMILFLFIVWAGIIFGIHRFGPQFFAYVFIFCEYLFVSLVALIMLGFWGIKENKDISSSTPPFIHFVLLSFILRPDHVVRSVWKTSGDSMSGKFSILVFLAILSLVLFYLPR